MNNFMPELDNLDERDELPEQHKLGILTQE